MVGTWELGTQKVWEVDFGSPWFFKFEQVIRSLGGGFKYCLFSPLVGEDFQFD